jgi:hypothetical protein
VERCWRLPQGGGVGTCLDCADSPKPRLETDLADPTSLYASCKLAHGWSAVSARQARAELMWARPSACTDPASILRV